MNIRNLSYLIVALLATALLWGCGSSGSGGSDFVGQRDIDPEYLGNANCLECHNGVHTTDEFTRTGGEINHLAGIIEAGNNSYYIAHACEDCHGGGSAHRGIGPIPYPQPDAARCAACHDEVNAVLASNHNRGDATNISMEAPGRSSAFCGACHTTERMVQKNIEPAGLLPATLHNISCAACHDSLTMEVRSVDNSCANCHSDLTVYEPHLRSKPFSNEIAERFLDGRHTGRARSGNCAACHSHEGGVMLLSQSEKIDTIGQIAALSDNFADLGSDLNVKTCATCHDPHSGEIRGIGDLTEVLGSSATATGPAERVVFSAQYNLCTSCHQVNLDYEFVDDIGYNSGGMFVYQLSDAYLHANDPYGDPSNVGYHSNSYQDRSFFDTHFNGLISKDLYYYDISDKKDRNGFSGVEKARRDRNGNLIVTNDMTEAIAMLEAYYQEYLDAPDDIQVNGYGVNPGSPYACSSCHDVHSANKIEGTADLIKADADGVVGHVLMAEPRMQQAVAYGEGVGMTHGNYISDAFSRERIGCTPCHTGKEFVSLTVGGEPESARWNSVGCISCHDMVDTAGVVLTEARTFPVDYEFAFNSGDVVAEDLGDNQVCFECHKGRNAYKSDSTTVYGTNYLHYSPSFATLLGPEGMYPSYDDKDYTRDWEGHYHAVSGYPTTCTGCHNIHEEYAPYSSFSQAQYGREEFDSVLTTNLCGSCHYVTDPSATNFQRSFNVLKGRTQVFADTLFATIISELSEVVASNNDAAIIIQGVNGVNVTLSADEIDSYTNVFGSSYATATTDDAIEKRLKTYITGSPRDVTGSRMVDNTLAKAGAVWKNFVYDDKGGWAHNSILARQLMYDAIVSLDPTKLDDLKTRANAMYLDLGLTQQQIDDNNLLGSAGNGSLMRYLSVAGGTQRTLP